MHRWEQCISHTSRLLILLTLCMWLFLFLLYIHVYEFKCHSFFQLNQKCFVVFFPHNFDIPFQRTLSYWRNNALYKYMFISRYFYVNVLETVIMSAVIQHSFKSTKFVKTANLEFIFLKVLFINLNPCRIFLLITCWDFTLKTQALPTISLYLHCTM